MKKKILVVEDDVAILTGLVDLLSSEGYEVLTATDGVRAIDIYHTEHPDLIILDVMIPDKHGYEVCKEIRKKDSEVLILMLTAKGQEFDKVLGLELGADDYITKPFGIKELLARVRTAFRRTEIKPGKRKNKDPISFGNVRIDVKKMVGYKKDKEFPLSEREIHLLQLFMANEGNVLERDMILETVWGIIYSGTTRTLDQHIVKLRQKIEDDPLEPRHILTVHGVGYRFQS